MSVNSTQDVTVSGFGVGGSAIISGTSAEGKRRVAYYYDDSIGGYHYGPKHPMKPHRVRMAHSLICSYGLYQQMDCFAPPIPCYTHKDLEKFHSPEYIKFLSNITAGSLHSKLYTADQNEFGIFDDCPPFDGLFDYAKSYTSGSVAAATRLNHGSSDIVINWSGGLHHAKRSSASGFCYVNDCVLSILELLKRFPRVLYIDIDVHHGDGVEEAFYTTNRVMTASFHRFNEGEHFFPGTGSLKDKGHGKGENYAINVPLKRGMTDESFVKVFQDVIKKIMERYSPSAIVLQCGADSLKGDRIGDFNLSLKGHSECVRFVRSYNIPTILMGGGGYTIKNVARCWALETAVALGVEISNSLPISDEYFSYYGGKHELNDLSVKERYPNLNTEDYLQKVTADVYRTLNSLEAVPGVPIHNAPPINSLIEENMDNKDPDVRS